MNKPDIIAAMAEQIGTKKASEEALEAFIAVISNALSRGERVQIMGFGTFEVANRAERIGRNPSTGETITIPATKAPKFKAGKTLKDYINS